MCRNEGVSGAAELRPAATGSSGTPMRAKPVPMEPMEPTETAEREPPAGRDAISPDVWLTKDGRELTIGEMYRPDLVMIPIGGHFVMNPKDAAMAVRDMIKPRFALPIHYGTTPQLRGTPAEFEAALGNAPGTAVMLKMDPGQKVDF